MGRSCEVHTVGTDAVVVRLASGPDAAHLRATAERLAAAAHPGVVEVVRSAGTDEHWELHLVHAGRPIDLVGPLSVEQIAGAAAAVAGTLADLHAMGIVHGNIDVSHVLIGPHGRPVLCGFGPTAASEVASPEDDVAAVGALIVTLLGNDAELEAIPARSWQRRRPKAGWARRSLHLVANRACADPASRRPTARRLAAAIAEAVPTAVVTTPAAAAPEEPTTAEDAEPVRAVPAPARLSALLFAVLGVLALGLGALRVGGAAVGTSSSTSVTTPLVTTPLVTSSTTTTVEKPISAPCTSAPVTPPGCDEEISVDGTIVTVGTRRYEVGQDGDLVVVGDWDGDGARTPALLRPATGEVFVFQEWATNGEVATGAVARVGDASDLRAEQRPGGDLLLVRRADGSWRPIVMEEMA